MKIENMDKFMQEIIRVPLLSKEEELALLKVVQEKGRDCDELEQLCLSNMRFVVALAVQYRDRGLKNLEELIPIGAEGLKKAAMSYDLDSDTPFIKDAVLMMRQCLEEAVSLKTDVTGPAWACAVYFCLRNRIICIFVGLKTDKP